MPEYWDTVLKKGMVTCFLSKGYNEEIQKIAPHKMKIFITIFHGKVPYPPLLNGCLLYIVLPDCKSSNHKLWEYFEYQTFWTHRLDIKHIDQLD